MSGVARTSVELTVPLVLVISEETVRTSYEEYADDAAYEGKQPDSFEDYCAGWVEGIVEEVCRGDAIGGHFYRIERASS